MSSSHIVSSANTQHQSLFDINRVNPLATVVKKKVGSFSLLQENFDLHSFFV